ncbi:hypothetical protein [Nocardia seriolae]|uniref:Uncharacterized protein n=1 Tax=Nocardia seriolae TaxID=37332 RepID=A0A0B8NGE5_9NOCA|nr:hypothetical protein [Nocardia seriolae]APA99942.1 hypothetical protein NS506_05906 [Nocardia seriolae]MTJ64626.1 hypothetical protein [Nocardia seriolae]MTJ76486.1 hypothetical protein [Nocardia seriolae]MTJ89470.1 hypothetical protein [Nocardia seriolae]MTK33446.1 hypothetical protein [Nocardia seriolae]
MATIAFPGAHAPLTVLSVLAAPVRRVRARHRLTDQELANLRLARSRAAVYTASLGGHPFRV